MINDGERTLRTHLGDAFKYSCSVGGTHWDHLGSGRDLPGPKPTLFFAPAQIKKRNAEWGAAALQTRIAEAWRAFMLPVMDAQNGWMRGLVFKAHGSSDAFAFERALARAYDAARNRLPFFTAAACATARRPNPHYS